MIVSCNWLKESIPTTLSPQELAHKLTMIGLEVEGIHDQDDDTILDVNLTPNKADSLSIFGIAREVSLFDAAPLKQIKVDLSTAPQSNLVPDISIQDTELCPRYTGLIMEGIKVGPSPDWMKKRLEASGVRSINLIVDVTNYVLLELGHPLHAFDLDLLHGKKIIVRKAAEGEWIKTLDGQDRKLTSEMLVIADAVAPVAVAGVMGGANSEINEKTTRILLEAAYFQPVSIRKTSRKLGLHTEASHRFERGCDYNCTVKAIQRAASLLVELIPGVKVSAVKDLYPKPIAPKKVLYRNNRYGKIMGIPVPFQRAVEVIRKIGATIESLDNESETVNLLVPSYRPDITEEIDIIEEIARINGYEQIPVTLPDAAPVPGLYDSFRKEYDASVAFKTLLKGAGLREVINYSFASGEFGAKMGLIKTKPIRLSNPLDSTQDIMRTELVSGLLQNLIANDRFLNRNLGIFEVGNVFADTGEKSASQEPRLALLLCGQKQEKTAFQERLNYDFQDLKGMLELVFSKCGVQPLYLPANADFLQKGKSAEIVLDGQPLGFMGELDLRKRALLDMKDLKESVLIAEISLSPLIRVFPKRITFKPLEKFHPVFRDIAVVVRPDISFEQLSRSICQHPFVEQVRLVDVFRGGNLAPDECSMTLSVKIGNNGEKALSESEISNAMAIIRQGLTEGLKLKLR